MRKACGVDSASRQSFGSEWNVAYIRHTHRMILPVVRVNEGIIIYLDRDSPEDLIIQIEAHDEVSPRTKAC